MSTDLPVHLLPVKRKKTPKGAFTNVLVRMPNPLREKVALFAAAGYRSKTAEVVARLAASFENQSIDEHGVIVTHSPRPGK